MTTTVSDASASNCDERVAPSPVLNPDLIVWIDTETTGLDHQSDWLLEIAVVVTDNDLREIAHFTELLHRGMDVRLLMDEVAHRMHTDSGLLAALADGKGYETVRSVERRLIAFLEEHGATGAVVAGSNVSFDRRFLDVWMPQLNREHLHYRSIDVSTVKELARRFDPNTFGIAPAKRLAHRALDDIRESIEELQHYVDYGFINAVEPDPCTAEIYSWEKYQPEQIDPYMIRCNRRGHHTEHHDSNTGLTWTQTAALAAEGSGS